MILYFVFFLIISNLQTFVKAHIYHWREVLDKFDEILAIYTSKDKDMASRYKKEQIVAILQRTTFLLREMIIHTEYYNSFDVC